jgi:hypothetical protein
MRGKAHCAQVPPILAVNRAGPAAVRGRSLPWLPGSARPAIEPGKFCTQFNLSPPGREDAAQTVWLRCPGWLATTTRRECLRQVTAARDAERPGNKPQEERQAPGDSAVEADVLTEERNAVLRAAFAEMPPQWQQLLSMLISDPPYSFAEISASLHIPVGNIGPLRVRALARMRISSQKKQRPASGTRGAGAGPPERRAPDENDGDEPRRDPGGDRP